MFSACSTDSSALILKKARPNQSGEICHLINLSYRGEDGWTRETPIIQGDRTSPCEINEAIRNPNGHFFVIYQLQKLVSCIYVEKQENNAYIGFFSVHPGLQDKGVGNYVLNQAELFARKKLQVKKYIMFVVSQRFELIAFYERRGYVRTGKIEAYPIHLGIGTPKMDGLTIEYLEKVIL